MQKSWWKLILNKLLTVYNVKGNKWYSQWILTVIGLERVYNDANMTWFLFASGCTFDRGCSAAI